MRGDWKAELPRAGCAFSRGGSQEFDPYIPPVLMVRCFTEESENEERNEFEDVAFQFDETCLEVYEYRCTRPCSVIYRVNLNGLNFNPQQQTLVMKVKDGNEPVCIGPELVVEEDEVIWVTLECPFHYRSSNNPSKVQLRLVSLHRNDVTLSGSNTLGRMSIVLSFWKSKRYCLTP